MGNYGNEIRIEDHILWAEPEKALLDWLYIHRKLHGVTPALDELNWQSLDVDRLFGWAEQYPHSVMVALGEPVS